MTLEKWKSKGQFFDYKSNKIFNIEKGSGEILLLIHGFPTASWDWWQMWDELTAKYRVLALDMIGFGFSDKPRKYPYSIMDQADLIEYFLDLKKVERVKILCHDYGDTVAQELLARYHDRISNEQAGVEIESICFLNGGLFPETHHAVLIQKLLISPIGSLIGRMINRKKLGKNFKKIFGPNTQPTEEELDVFWKLVSSKRGKYIAHLLIRYMKERKENRERWVGILQETDIPIRVIDGVFDPVSGQQMVDRYKELIPNPDVIELQDIGHFPLIEAPDMVLKHYFEFEANNEAAIARKRIA